MDNYYQELLRAGINRRDKSVTNNLNLSVLHQNIKSISDIQIELNLVFKLRLKNTEVLCFTEHWVKAAYLILIHLDRYKLVSHFSREMNDHGGSCICVKKGIRTKELNCFKVISAEKKFEMSVIELVDYGCVYRSPDNKVQTFF